MELYDLADVTHCLSFEQVCDEVLQAFSIGDGSFDSVAQCEYRVPSYLSIGKVYARLVEDVASEPAQYLGVLFRIFQSDLSDQISDFHSALFFASRGELASYFGERYSGLLTD